MRHFSLLQNILVAGVLVLGTAGASPVSAAKAPTIRELEALAAEYEAALARVRSHNAIENLQAAYGYYIDKGLWGQAAALFARNGIFEYGQRGVYVGPGRIRQALGLFGPEGLQQGQLNNYLMLQPIIDVAEDNQTAKARWRSFVQLSRDGEGRWGTGVYENEYVNVEGVWKIKSLHYYVTMEAPYDGGWGKAQYPMAGPSKELPPDRPPTEEYEALPGVYLPPYHYDHPVTGKPVPGGKQ